MALHVFDEDAASLKIFKLDLIDHLREDHGYYEGYNLTGQDSTVLMKWHDADHDATVDHTKSSRRLRPYKDHDHGKPLDLIGYERPRQ